MVTRGFSGRSHRANSLIAFLPASTLSTTSRSFRLGRRRGSLWRMVVYAEVGPEAGREMGLGRVRCATDGRKLTRDIHCVTTWSKLNTAWEGVHDRRYPGGSRNRAADRLHPRPLARRVFHQYTDRRHNRRKGDDALRITKGGRLWKITAARTIAGAPFVFLEVRQVARGFSSPSATKPASGNSAAITCMAILGANSGTRMTEQASEPSDSTHWQTATVDEIVAQTPHIKSFFLVPVERFAFRAGQHVDLRLTAPDGYRAIRSYSIASAPEDASRDRTGHRAAR